MQINMHEAQALANLVSIEKHYNVILGTLEGAFDVPENFDDSLPQ